MSFCDVVSSYASPLGSRLIDALLARKMRGGMRDRGRGPSMMFAVVCPNCPIWIRRCSGLLPDTQFTLISDLSWKKRFFRTAIAQATTFTLNRPIRDLHDAEVRLDDDRGSQISSGHPGFRPVSKLKWA